MLRERTQSALAAAALLSAIACSRAQPLENDVRRRVSWQEEVAPLFAARCTPCHAGATAAAGYDTTDYLKAITAAAAGDPNSRLLAMLNPSTADSTHLVVSDSYSTVRAWVVDGRLSFFRSGIHEGGILNPADPNEFHGAVLKSLKWSFATCQGCHGADFAGGKAGVSCLSCHAQGPTSCTTCHGQPPPSGGHLAHVNGIGLGKKLDCSECHVKPAHWDDPGHLFDAAGKQRQRAAIAFGKLAGPLATFNPSDASCSSVYCHGSATPKWNSGPTEASCGSCHALPPANHVSKLACNACHGAVTDRNNQLLTPALHITGSVHLGGDGTGACNSCHGQPPPTGAHLAHVTAQHALSKPIDCGNCHVVPQAVNDPGHIDHDGPATVTFSGLAVTDGAAPALSRPDLSCSATYCHGGGNELKKDLTPGLLRTPSWTQTGAAECGTCHGVPPKDSAHTATMRLQDCATCHPGTIDDRGTLIPGGTHLNGVLDVVAH